MTFQRARALRRNSTGAERLLWSRLRNRASGLHRFRRQHPIGPYIADFASRTAKLVIELDGSEHAEQMERDAARTAYLEAQGYRVLRFWNNDVLGNIEGVLDVIAAALDEVDKSERRRP